MSIENFCDSFERNINARLADISKPLLDNGCNTIEHFKLLSGLRKGLMESLEIAKKTYKDIYESEDVNLKSGVKNESSNSSKKSERRFY